MKRTYLLAVLFFLASAPILQAIKITHGPYLCDMSTDGVTVVWTTDKPALSWVELAPDGKDSFYAKEQDKYFDTVSGRKRANQTLHRVRLKKLEPGTSYRYRIFSQEVTEWTSGDWVTYGRVASSNVYSQEPYSFRTFTKEKKDISFLILNDIHSRSDDMKELCKDVDFSALDFVVLNGDMTTFVENEEMIFDGYMDAAVELFAKETPLIYTRGNHETRGTYSDELIKYFPSQTHQFYQLAETGGVSFLILDSGEDKPDSDIEYGGIAAFDEYREEQAEWIDEVVSTDAFKQANARVAFMHIPPSTGTWHGTLHLEKVFMPILNRSNIDVMFSGHTHRYIYMPPSAKNTFPIVVNDHQSYALCHIRDGKIQVELIGGDGKKHVHEFPLKK